jgi:hypothetical protein
MSTKPVVILSDEFAGADELSAEQLDRLLVDNFTDVAGSLMSEWDADGLVIIPMVTLNNTNSAISNANVILQGRMFHPKKDVSAKRFFRTEDAAIQLVIKSLDARKFKFRGRLSSELLDCSDVDYSLTKEGRELTYEELSAMDFAGFCLRAFINPTPPAGWAKIDVSVYPLAEEELRAKYSLAADPRFPGLSLAHPTGLVPMGPLSSTLFPEADWGCPIAPAILALTSTAAHPLSVTAKALKQALAGILRTNIKADNQRNYSYLIPRWEEILAKGQAGLSVGTPDFIWPSALVQLPDEGDDLGAAGSSQSFRPPPPRGRTASSLWCLPPPPQGLCLFVLLIYRFC